MAPTSDHGPDSLSARAHWRAAMRVVRGRARHSKSHDAPRLVHHTPIPAYDACVPRQRSSDLFPTDQPIPASQMIGREADVRELVTALESGANLIVAGPRRTGKTSVCDAAVGRLAKRGFYDVSIDPFRVA